MFSYIQTLLGSTFFLFLRVFVDPNASWIYVFPIPLHFHRSKHTLDLRFSYFFAFSYIQAHFGSMFFLLLCIFIDPNTLWIYVFAVPSSFHRSKPRFKSTFLRFFRCLVHMKFLIRFLIKGLSIICVISSVITKNRFIPALF